MDLAQMALQGSVLIVIVVAIRGLFGRKMPKAVLPVLWGLVLVRLLVPFSIATPWSAWSFAGQSLAESGSKAGSTVVERALDGAGVLPVVAESPAKADGQGNGLVEAGTGASFVTAGTAWGAPVQQDSAGTGTATQASDGAEGAQANEGVAGITQQTGAVAASGTSSSNGAQAGTTAGSTIRQIGSGEGTAASANGIDGVRVDAGYVASATNPAGAGAALASTGSVQGASIAAPLGSAVASLGAWFAGLAAWQVVWAIGSLACLLVAGAIYLHFIRQFRLAVPVEDPFARAWLQAHPLRRHMRIKACSLVRSPMTYGLLRPTILVPADLDWSDRVRVGLMLEHELVHIRRFDIAFKAALVVALCLHWFNPLVWALYVLANHDLELSCDERVLRRLNGHGRAAYAGALIDAAESGAGLLPAAAGFGKSALSRRVSAIVHPGRPRAIATAAAALLVVAATTAFATTGVISADAASGARDTADPSGVPDVQHIRVTGGVPSDENAGASADDGTAFVPSSLGSLPWPGENPVEITLDGYRIIATPFYAVTLPESMIGDDFAWSYDGQTEFTAEHQAEPQGTVQASASKVLSITGALDAQGQPVSFKVFRQTSNEYKTWTGPCPLGAEYTAQRIGSTFIYVATADGTTPDAHGLLRLVSTDGYAYPQREENGQDGVGGTRVVTPGYSVLVPDGALSEGWTFAYGYEDLGAASYPVPISTLRLYDSAESRAIDDPAVVIASFGLGVADSPEEAVGSARVIRVMGASSASSGENVCVLSPVLGLGDQDPSRAAWEEQVETWAGRVSLDGAATRGRTVAITEGLWRIETPRYTFDVPEYWRGRVEARFTTDGKVSIHPNGHPELDLVSIKAYGPGDGPWSGGDVASATIYSMEDGYGNRVTAHAINYVWLALGPSWRDGRGGLPFPGDDVAREVVDLSTEGAYSFDELEATDPRGFPASDGFVHSRSLLATNMRVNMEPTWAAAMSLAFEDYEDMSVAQFQQKALETLGNDRELLARVVTLADSSAASANRGSYYNSEQGSFVRDILVPLLSPLLSDTPVSCELSGQGGADPIGYLTYTISARVDDPQAASVLAFRTATSWFASQLDRLPSTVIVDDMAMDPETARRALEIAIDEAIAERSAPGIAIDVSWDYVPGTMAAQG